MLYDMLYELTPTEANVLAAAARILAQRAQGPVEALSLRANAGTVCLVVETVAGHQEPLATVPLFDDASGAAVNCSNRLASSVREFNARR